MEWKWTLCTIAAFQPMESMSPPPCPPRRGVGGMVDIATSWVELVAVLGRSSLVLKRIPFPIREIHLSSMLTSSVSGGRRFLVLFSPAALPITRMITDFSP